jgi:hypothetical protein
MPRCLPNITAVNWTRRQRKKSMTNQSNWRNSKIQMPKFDIWERESLVDFAGECYVKLCEQDDIIQQLQCDLKTAIEAYREANK